MKREVFQIGGGVFAHGSAAVAYLRLREVIRDDRDRVPCGRWVQQHYDCIPIAFVVALGCALISAPRDTRQLVARSVRRQIRPRYRYEVRK